LVRNLYNIQEFKNYIITSIGGYNFYSIENIFLNSNWMERECGEMSNISFLNKYDNRNLLLQYMDLFSPILKKNSSLGFFEIFFNFINNNLYRFNVVNI